MSVVAWTVAKLDESGLETFTGDPTIASAELAITTRMGAMDQPL